jgi:hypothetical protein
MGGCHGDAYFDRLAHHIDEATTSPRREEKAQHAKETPTLRRNSVWHHD